MTAFQMAVKHLTRYRAQSLMLLLSLAFSVGAAGLLLRIYTLTQSRFETIAQGGQAIVGGKAGGIDILLGSLNLEAQDPKPLPLNLFNSLRAGQTVKFEDGTDVSTSKFVNAVIPMLFVGKNEKIKLIATDLSFFNRPADSLGISSGAFFNEVVGNEVVVGAAAAKELNVHVGDAVTFMTPKGEIKLNVVGILSRTDSAWDRGAYMGLTSAYAFLSQKGDLHPVWKNGILHYFLVYMKPEGFKPLQSLINDRTVAEVISVPEEMQKLSELTGAGGDLGLVIIAFIVLLTALSVTGVMMIRFENMRLQAAVLRAMGFPVSYMLKWLLSEGMVLALAACVLGALIDLALFGPLVNLLGRTVPSVDIANPTIFWSFPIWVMATLATLIGVLIPFRRLYNLDVHSVLKGF